MYRKPKDNDIIRILPKSKWITEWKGLIKIVGQSCVMIRADHPEGKRPGSVYNFSGYHNPFNEDRYGTCWEFYRNKNTRIISWL